MDRTTYNELVELIGEPRVHALLGRLEKLLLGRFEDNLTDVARLAADSHALVSVAGMLGFLELSDASRDLEQACLTRSALDPLLARNLELCQAALLEIATLKRASQAA